MFYRVFYSNYHFHSEVISQCTIYVKKKEINEVAQFSYQGPIISYSSCINFCPKCKIHLVKLFQITGSAQKHVSRQCAGKEFEEKRKEQFLLTSNGSIFCKYPSCMNKT